jgi:plastocyanin
MKKLSRYKLFIENRSDIAHALSLPEFSAMIEDSSAPAFPYLPEEIEVAAGQTVEWFFVPVKAGRYKVGCAAEAGTVGTIVVN